VTRVVLFDANVEVDDDEESPYVGVRLHFIVREQKTTYAVTAFAIDPHEG